VAPRIAATRSSASGCAQGVDASLIQDIMGNPAGFYVNTHNKNFPSGVVRGQLVRLKEAAPKPTCPKPKHKPKHK